MSTQLVPLSVSRAPTPVGGKLITPTTSVLALMMLAAAGAPSAT
jgi:hypothetical protein